MRLLHPKNRQHETHQMIHAPELSIDLQCNIREILILPSLFQSLAQLHAHRQEAKLNITNALKRLKLSSVI
jgi:hypothetical protein